MSKRGSVSSYEKGGRTFYRVRISIDGKVREVYSHKGVRFTSADHAQAVLHQIHGRLADATGSKLAAIADFLPRHSKPNLVATVLRDYVSDMEERLTLKQISQYSLRNVKRYCPVDPAPLPAAREARARALRRGQDGAARDAADFQYFRWWEGVSIHEVRQKNLERFKRYLEARGLKPRSVRTVLDQFRAFLGWCKNQELLVSVPDFPTVKIEKSRPRLLTRSKQRRVLEQIPWDRRGVFLALVLGIRPGAARAARVEDASGGFLNVHRASQAPDASDPGDSPTKAARELGAVHARALGMDRRAHRRPTPDRATVLESDRIDQGPSVVASIAHADMAAGKRRRRGGARAALRRDQA